MGPIEEDRPIPLSDDVTYGLNGKWEKRHRGSQCNKFGSHQRRDLAEEFEVNFEFDGIEWDINDLQTAHPCRSINTVAGMTSEGL